MTRKTYKSAMGKTVDLGALILENEQVRAVGNMKVNARGDVLDSDNQVIDTKTKQVQRQYKKQTVNVSANTPISTGTMASRRAKQEEATDELPEDLFLDIEYIVETLSELDESYGNNFDVTQPYGTKEKQSVDNSSTSDSSSSNESDNP